MSDKAAPNNEPYALTRREMVMLGGLFLAALLIRLYFVQFYKVISADGVGYVLSARDIVSGAGWGKTATYGMVYPSLVGLASLPVGDMELAGRLVSIVMGSLLVIPLYLVSKELFSKWVGVMACILVLVWSPLRMWSCEVMTQATYITLLMTGLYLVRVAIRRVSFKVSFFAGMVMALSYLTRPEALVTFVAIVGAMFIAGLLLPIPRQRLLQMLLAACAGFALPLVPYIFLIHHYTGSWQLAGKTGNTVADALSEYLGRPDLKTEPGFQGIGVLDVIRQYPDFLWPNFVKNLRETWELMFPPYLWALALIGFVTYGWDRERIAGQLLLVSTFAPLLVIMVFFFVGPEYLQPYLPVLFLWAGAGLVWLERTIISRLGIERWPMLNRAVGVVPVSVLAVVGMAAYLLVTQVPANANEPYHFSQDGARYDHKRIGLMLKQVLAPHSRIMTRFGRISFYAEMDQIMVPQAGIPELIDTAVRNNARYVVIDGLLAQMRPQFEPLYRPLFMGEEKEYYLERGTGYRPLPMLKMAFLYKDPSSVGVVVYEVLHQQ